MESPPVILLVDDSIFFLALEKQFLRKFPITVLEARSAAQALALLQEQRPDLIYMAYDLPDLDGAACCRRLKADARLRSIPVVLICDVQATEQLDVCRAAGAGGVLTKPLDRHKFMEMGRRFLAGIREHRQTCLFQLSWRADGDSCPGKCLDLSNGGLFVETPEQPPTGTVVQISFVLPGQPPVSVEASGKVAWHNTRTQARKPNYPVGFGIRFTAISDRATAAIRDFLLRKGSS
jgi:CheY-like chemotaxis protein